MTPEGRPDTSYGKRGEVYDRQMTRCEKCDIWLSIEVPQEKEEPTE